MWFPDYIEEIECDFAAIYGMQDMWSLDGPKFVRFASRLPLYEGAVRYQISMDYKDSVDEDGNVIMKDSSVERTSTKKMSDLVKETVKDHVVDSISAMNAESHANGMGDLFERVTVSSN